LADFPTNGGGGSSVAYYLNGSVNQGTFAGNTYYEMNKTPVIGTGTDFTISSNGYIAQFITDANDPASLLIPAGNWNVEMYFSASSNGGTPSFYVEVYKYNGTTFTPLGTSSATPEGITNGTAIDIYYTSIGIPETVLTITDRLAIRVYVTNSGRTITLHTEDNHLSEIITTFSNGINTLNGLTKQAQYFAVGSTGTDFNISSSVDTHTFNIPDASATARGLITTGTQTIAGTKTFTTANRTIFTNADFFQVEFSNGSSKLNLGSVIGESYIYSSGDLRFGTNYPTDSLLSPKLIIATSGLVTITNQLRLNSTITNGTYTYTLPSATGTLALTSDIHSAVTLAAIGSTPNANAATLTGQVLNLEPASASFGGVVTTGTQTFAGAKTFNDNISVSTSTANSAIQATSTKADGRALSVLATSSLEPFSVTQNGAGKLAQFNNSAGAKFVIYNSGEFEANGGTLYANLAGTTANFTGQLTLGSTITNGTYTYTLPSATGTLALTSALSAYLPLTGGTLTGNANFQLVNAASPSISIRRSSSSYDATINYNDNGSSRWTVGVFGDTTADYKFFNVASGANSIKIGYGTDLVTLAGALAGTSATFSGDIRSSAGIFYAADGTAALPSIRFWNNSTGFSNSSGALVVSTESVARLTIASTGAATFSSSVTATAFFESSSVAGKDIIKTNPLTNLNLDVIQYTRKTDESKDVRYGYSAEQIHSLMPELTDKDVTSVKYLDVHTILIAQLQQEIKELKAKLN
jgi:hypothetical protein